MLLSLVSAWSFGWEALVAIGTLLLAIATVLLAASTRRLARETKDEVSHAARHVEATQEQARIANDALQVANEQTGIAQRTLGAQIRPVLIDMPLEPSIQEAILYAGIKDQIAGHRGSVHAGTTSNGPVISLPVRNAGAGLAIIRGVGLRVGEPIPSPPVTIMPANLPVGEDGRINFAIPLDHPAAEPVQRVLRASGSFSIEIAYTDLAGQQLVVSRFDLYYHPQANWNWQVRQVHHHEPGMDEPFAGSAPTA
jgi:hypothetical protein